MFYKKKIALLEKRIAALEVMAQVRQADIKEMTESVENALRDFCGFYRLDVPEQLKEKE